MLYGFLGVIYILLCFVGWYLLWDANKNDNASFKCYLFGGQRHRAENIKESCARGVDYFSRKNHEPHFYTREEVISNNLYEEVFWEKYDSRIKFFAKQFYYFLVGPIVVLFIVLTHLLDILGLLN